MVCLSKTDNNWNYRDCKSLYDANANVYTCLCNHLSPTTVIEDVDSLLTENNLGVAFGSEGITNITSFNNFYEYAVFWALLTLTGVCGYLYYKGKMLDLLTTNKR